MAKYAVTHSCGHDQVHVLFGKHKDRESKIEWLATTLCTDCYHGKLRDEREAASKQCHDWSKSEGLSPLTGTEKQIAWAETLRASMLGNVRIEADRIKAHIEEHKCGDDPAMQAAWAAILDSLTWLSQQAMAKFWIDNRDRAELELILLCPYCAPHASLIAPRTAARLSEEREAKAAEALKLSEAEANKVRLAAKREADRARLAALMGDGVALAVKTDGDKKRVYIGGHPASVTYYATGDRYHAAGSIEIASKYESKRDEILEFCRDICERWTQFRIN